MLGRRKARIKVAGRKGALCAAYLGLVHLFLQPSPQGFCLSGLLSFLGFEILHLVGEDAFGLLARRGFDLCLYGTGGGGCGRKGEVRPRPSYSCCNRGHTTPQGEAGGCGRLIGRLLRALTIFSSYSCCNCCSRLRSMRSCCSLSSISEVSVVCFR